jgi:hypothetical protein
LLQHRGVFGALAGAISEYASIEMKKNIAAGIGVLAAGLGFPFSGIDPVRGSLSAKQHFLAAGLWPALAGVSGAAQGAIAGGGRGGLSGGIPSGASDIGGRLAQSTVPKNQIILMIDGFDPRNGEHIRILGNGVRELARRDSRHKTEVCAMTQEDAHDPT